MKTKEQNQQSKEVKQWRDLYLLKGIVISHERCDEPTLTMKSSYPQFHSYQAAVPIRDVTKLEKNAETFKKKYPTLLKTEIEKMMAAYPEEAKYREDYQICLRMYGGLFR